MITDTHCHLASHRFSADEVHSLIARAQSRSVSRLVTLSTSLTDVARNLEIAAHPDVYACVGIHPCDVHHAPEDACSQLETFCADPRVCAIGETGLDYYHPAPAPWSNENFHSRQIDFLHQHFALAARTGLNIVIHTRDTEGHASFDDALAIYQQYHTTTRAVFHCFIGSWENAQRVIDLGGVLSFGGVATFKNAKNVLETACKCPAGSIMLETDSPYLAPVPHRGQRNEPSYTADIAEFLATQRHESLEEFATHTSQTANRFFRFRKTFIE